MKLSAAGLELLKKAEGFRSKAYKDIAGRATIGYGHRIGPNEIFPDEITEAKAEAILQWDIHEAEESVTRLVKVPLSQGQFDALVDFTFNLGATRLRDSTLLEVLNDGNYDAAGRQLLRWDHSGTREVMALEARREAECRLWTGNVPPQTTAASAL
jgi:lysozyme